MKSIAWLGLTALMVSLSNVGAQNQPNPAADMWKNKLITWSKRLIEVQHATPDANINKIIQDHDLNDADALAKLDGAESEKTVKQIAVALYQASTKPDPIAAQLMKEFEISYAPNPPSPKN